MMAGVDDALAPLAWLVGTWRGASEGEPGRGAQERRYEAVLRGRFLMGTNRTVWEPTADHPDGESHQDLSLIGFDRASGRFVMHVFYVERFIAAFVCEDTSADTWVFTADSVQNGPVGMRSRETFQRRGDTFGSLFEVAMPGKDFSPYTRESLARA